MRTTLTLAAFLLAVGAVSTARAAEEYHDGYVRIVEPGVTLQRATEVSAEEAVPNLPFLPGDRVWTDASGRAEFRFLDGSAVRLDRQSKLDYQGLDESGDRVVLRLWSGSLILRNRTGQIGTFEIETPGGVVRVSERGVVRVDVGGGETWVSAYEGWATLDTGRDRVEVGPGERAAADWGGGVSPAQGFDRYAGDDFAAWDSDVESRESWAATGRRYLPQELSPYAAELDSYGTWDYEPSAGYVWRPQVAVSVGWTPYSNGYWAWTPTWGYSWVGYEPWGWAPYHYGRWGYSASFGWYWSPGTVWGPGWVSWWVGGGHVGWCPLGRHGRPVTPWPHHRGYAVPRGGSHGHPSGWSVARSGDLGRRDLARRRIDAESGSFGSVRLAENGGARPTRNGLTLADATSLAPSAMRRPRPGGAAERTLPTTPGTARGGFSRARTSPSPSAAEGSSTAGTVRARPRTGERTPGNAGVEPERRIPGIGSSRSRSTDPPAAGTGRSGSGGNVPGIGSSRPRPSASPRENNDRTEGSTRTVPGMGSSRSRSSDPPATGNSRAEPRRPSPNDRSSSSWSGPSGASGSTARPSSVRPWSTYRPSSSSGYRSSTPSPSPGRSSTSRSPSPSRPSSTSRQGSVPSWSSSRSSGSRPPSSSRSPAPSRPSASSSSSSRSAGSRPSTSYRSPAPPRSSTSSRPSSSRGSSSSSFRPSSPSRSSGSSSRSSTSRGSSSGSGSSSRGSSSRSSSGSSARSRRNR